MYEDEKIRAAGDLSMRKEGRGATLLRSLCKRRNEESRPISETKRPVQKGKTPLRVGSRILATVGNQVKMPVSGLDAGLPDRGLGRDVTMYVLLATRRSLLR